MVDHSKIKMGDKLPGTYCPLCGSGLTKREFDGAIWAVCPADSKTLKDAHTAYVISTKATPTKSTSSVLPKETKGDIDNG